MAKNGEQFKSLPDQHILTIYQYITGLENMTDTELSKPILRPGLYDTYILFIIQYALLSLIGMITNIWIIYYIARHKLYRDNTHAFFINLSICHFVQSAFVVPVTLVVIIVHNWILGQFMCYFVPMLQVSKFIKIPYKQKNPCQIIWHFYWFLLLISLVGVLYWLPILPYPICQQLMYNTIYMVGLKYIHSNTWITIWIRFNRNKNQTRT